MTALLPKNVELLEKMLDYSALRQRIIANNIANVNTPGFRQSEVDIQALVAARSMINKALEIGK